MAIRLKIEGNIHSRDLFEDSVGEDKIYVESYAEGEFDNIKWRLDLLCRYLLAEGFPKEVICKYLNFEDDEVWELDDK